MTHLSDVFAIGAYESTADIINHVRLQLGDAPYEDELTAAIVNTDTTMYVLNPDRFVSGDVAEFPASGEQVKIQSQASGGLSGSALSNPLTMKRSHNNTTPAASLSAGSVILKGMKYDQATITDSVTQTILGDLFPYVWVGRVADVTPSTTTNIYPVPNEFIDIIGASQESTSTITDTLEYGPKTGMPILVRDNIDFSLATYGKSFYFPGGFYNLVNPVKVFYRARVTAVTVPPGEVSNMVVMKVCARLMQAQENQKMAMPQAQGGTNVNPGVFRSQSAWYESQFRETRARFNAYLRTVAKPQLRFVRG